MRVLVTRPQADAAPLIAELEARGHETLLQPLLTIEAAQPPPEIDLEGVQALLFTSANGLRGFAALSPRRDLPVFTVGDASGAAARAAGFARVASAGGDVEDLAHLVIERLDPATGAVFHGAGASLAGDLKGALEDAGFAVRRAVLYNAQPAETLAEDVRAALAAGSLDAIAFFSPRTAVTFARLVEKHGLEAACATCRAVCLSAAVAERLGSLPWRGMTVAARPERDALLACLDDPVDRGACGGVRGGVKGRLKGRLKD